MIFSALSPEALLVSVSGGSKIGRSRKENRFQGFFEFPAMTGRRGVVEVSIIEMRVDKNKMSKRRYKNSGKIACLDEVAVLRPEICGSAAVDMSSRRTVDDENEIYHASDTASSGVEVQVIEGPVTLWKLSFR